MSSSCDIGSRSIRPWRMRCRACAGMCRTTSKANARGPTSQRPRSRSMASPSSGTTTATQWTAPMPRRRPSGCTMTAPSLSAASRPSLSKNWSSSPYPGELETPEAAMCPDTRIEVGEVYRGGAVEPPSARLDYLSGFGNEQQSEAIPGTLPQGQNAPQTPPRGLYTEQLSGTPFTAPRAENRRSLLYRIRTSAMHKPLRQIDNGLLLTAPCDEATPSPNRLRWNPLPYPDAPTDFIDGLPTIGTNGDAAARSGIGVLVYRATRPMTDRAFYDADGELLIVPQEGRLLLVTEFGRVEAAPGEIAIVPRGVKFRVELPDGKARGYVCENYRALVRLPELGPIGANGLANPRDFPMPCAAFEERDKLCELVAKFEGSLWATELSHSPFDVVAWHGNHTPCKYELARFNTIGTVSFDHPDPSIFTVLTSPPDPPGPANCDFVIFPRRWQVAEHPCRPPSFHRHVMRV